MVEVLGELKALVIKGEDCLKEGQHLKRSQDRKKQIRYVYEKSQQVKEKLLTKHNSQNNYDIMSDYRGIVTSFQVRKNLYPM